MRQYADARLDMMLEKATFEDGGMSVEAFISPQRGFAGQRERRRHFSVPLRIDDAPTWPDRSRAQVVQ
jgi:hypothetical protein